MPPRLTKSSPSRSIVTHLVLALNPLFDGRREVDAVGCFHPRLGPSDQALPLFQELDLHALTCR